MNYPKIHIRNGESKNQVTGEYKATVRMVKNLKSEMIDKGKIKDTLAPSYFVESLISNLPNDKISGVRASTLFNLAVWYDTLNADDRKELRCGNGLQLLFFNISTAWNESDATDFMTALWNYYLNGT